MDRVHQPSSMAGYTLPKFAYRTPPEISSKAPSSYPVIVVGAGLAGLMAALELGSRGIQTVVLDDDDTVGAAGLSSRGICYAKRSLEILDRFGASERIRAKGVTWNEGEVYRGEHLLYRFNLQPETDQKFPAFVNLQQFYVEQYLVESLGTLAAVDLRWRNKVVEAHPSEGSVRVTVETPEGRYTTEARYLIAADGGNGVMRALVGAQDEELSFYEDRWCIADVKLDTREEAVRKAYLDGIPTQGGAIWYHQMADGVWRTDWQISHLPDPDAEATPERAAERLRKLVGPEVGFELVWVGPWRFKKRLLRRLQHGRIFFVGDAAHEHSPFGARGGNAALQDANNLAWKLALVIENRAHADLLETYDEERHLAARENTENATRSAIFIAPETHGQRLIRNAILDLAKTHVWARPLVNVGRLSVATTYASSTLNRQAGAFASALAQPGAAAPDGRIEDGFLIERLQGHFTVAYFGRSGPPVEGAETLVVSDEHRTLLQRYAVPPEGATYVFRPDGHVLARAFGIDAAFARDAIRGVFDYRLRTTGSEPMTTNATGKLTQIEADRMYDALAALVDATPAAERERVLARLCVTLAERLADSAKILEAIGLVK